MNAIETALCSHIILPSNDQGQEEKIPVLIANSDVIVPGISRRYPVEIVELVRVGDNNYTCDPKRTSKSSYRQYSSMPGSTYRLSSTAATAV